MVQGRAGERIDMKDINLMHYFLGLEVWSSLVGYAIEILKRFQMMDCKPVATPMVANLKSFVDSKFRFD